jgi:hypothetical protein
VLSDETGQVQGGWAHVFLVSVVIEFLALKANVFGCSLKDAMIRDLWVAPSKELQVSCRRQKVPK